MTDVGTMERLVADLRAENAAKGTTIELLMRKTPGVLLNTALLRTKDAEIRQLRGELAAATAELARAQGPALPVNLGGYEAWRDAVCDLLLVPRSWSWSAVDRLHTELARREP